MTTCSFRRCQFCGTHFFVMEEHMTRVESQNPTFVNACETCQNPRSFLNMFRMFESRRQAERS